MAPLMTGITSSGKRSRATAQVPTAVWARVSGVMVPFTPTSALELAGATGFLIFGYVFSVTAMRVGEISFVAPFRYASLLVALILWGLDSFLGWLVSLAIG